MPGGEESRDPARDRQALPDRGSSREPADWGLVKNIPATQRWDETSWSLWDRLRRWVAVERPEPEPSYLEPVEPPPKPEERQRVGICCSGGGIRSASFNLGALQQLGPQRLQSAKYLAAVSGGSYIAAAFAMVAKTGKQPRTDGDSASARRRAATRSDGDDSAPDLVTEERPPFYPGSPEEQYLRNRVSYMAPARGGRARLVWRVLCGLLVNVAVIAAVLTLLAVPVAEYYRWEHPDLDDGGVSVVTDPHLWRSGIGFAVAGGGLLAGLVLVAARPSETVGRRLEAWSLRLFGAGLVLVLLEPVLPELLAWLVEWRNPVTDEELPGVPQEFIWGSVGTTVSGILATVLLQIRAQIADPRDAIENLSAAASRLEKLAPRLRRAVLAIAIWVLGPLLLVAMFVGLVMLHLQAGDVLRYGSTLVALVLFALVYHVADLTSWSLHPFYRRRLCTAFALKRVHRPNELCDDRGVAMERRQEALADLSDTRVVPDAEHWPDDRWPTLLVCAAANISDPGATPPGRSVTSFTFSPEALGGPLVGGISTKTFEDSLNDQRRQDFTLPAVVAISGAALSPSMGKHTRPGLRFLMGLANVRLGVWVPNPRRQDTFIETPTRSNTSQPQTKQSAIERCKKMVTPAPPMPPEDRAEMRSHPTARNRHAPTPTPRYLLKELLGISSVNDKFLYVTDGGHYENLGLVELLRRGCTRIYCFDASAGRALGELGEAVALARSELGVEIEFEPDELERLREKADADDRADVACVAGRFRYTRGREADGIIVYAPTVMTRDVPSDVHAFKERDPAFPHHATVDQLFSDQKFEAYRVLGRHAATSAVRAMDDAERGESTIPTTGSAGAEAAGRQGSSSVHAHRPIGPELVPVPSDPVSGRDGPSGAASAQPSGRFRRMSAETLDPDEDRTLHGRIRQTLERQGRRVLAVVHDPPAKVPATPLEPSAALLEPPAGDR